MSLACSEVAAELARIVDDRTGASAAVIDHVEHCLTCQRELAHYRRLLRMLASLKSDTACLPEGALANVLAGIASAAERRAMRDLLAHRRVRYLSGLGLSAAALLVAVGLLRGRRFHHDGHAAAPERSEGETPSRGSSA